MKEYDISYFEMNKEKKQYIVFSTSYISPLKFITDIEKELSTLQLSNTIDVVFDLLLSSGNSKERYGKAIFNGESFDKRSFKYIEVSKSDKLRNLSVNYYKNHCTYIENSILNSIQKKMICKGIAI